MVSYRTEQDVHILSLVGSILHKDSELLRDYFEGLYDAKAEKIIIDLLKTYHICSSALGHMVYMENRLRSYGGEIKLVVTDEDLNELLEITLLNQVFLIYKTVQEAIQSFK
ncbi:MAG: STAS domain-containing protein [Leptospiraceae bacterium]|nr:STAS domain-containing protein [Leptospiraceae bacterium]